MQIVLLLSIVLALVAIFCWFCAIAHIAYPQSRTTVEVYPTDVRPPRRWLQISVYAGLGLLLACVAAYLFTQVFLPAHILVEIENVTRQTFKDKLQRDPVKLHFEEDGMEEGRWKYKGTAWLDDREIWDVTVTWRADAWECRAERRE
jgi:hypothetical protein